MVPARDNKQKRRTILLALYEAFEKTPQSVLTPRDIVDATGIARDELGALVCYLEERGYVECMRRFGEGTLFGGVRISADGIDVVEDPLKLDLLFPETPRDQDDRSADTDARDVRIKRAVDNLYAIASSDLAEIDLKDSVAEDLSSLEWEFSRASDARRLKKILALLEFIQECFNGCPDATYHVSVLRQEADRV